MSGSTTEPGALDRACMQRLRQAPLGPYDPELRAWLQPWRNQAGPGKLALMRMPAEQAWTVVRLGGRDQPVTVVGGRYISREQAEWAVLRQRCVDVKGWDPGPWNA